MPRQFRHAAALFAFVACSTLPIRELTAQSVPPPRDIWSGDDARAAWLEQHGRTVKRLHVVVVAPGDSVSEAWQQSLADTLDRGVAALRRLIGGPYPWQRIADRPATPLTFYVSPEQSFPGHGTGRDALFFALSEVIAGNAGLLREASHELLVPTCRAVKPCYPSPWERPDTVPQEVKDRFPNWLFWYGIAGYLAHTVADAEKIQENTKFDGGLAEADSLCAARVRAHPRGTELLRGVGTAAPLSGLHTTEARIVAPVYFPCTLSMTKFLVDQMGLGPVLALFPAIRAGTWERDIERSAGAPLPELRRRWLKKLGLPDA